MWLLPEAQIWEWKYEDGFMVAVVRGGEDGHGCVI
jgi:hypothetical protein